jgi:hypothetical protein
MEDAIVKEPQVIPRFEIYFSHELTRVVLEFMKSDFSCTHVIRIKRALSPVEKHITSSASEKGGWE